MTRAIARLDDEAEKWHDAYQAMKVRAEKAEAASEIARLQGRLDAFREIHEHWEFEDLSEEAFDAWLHEQIKALRRQVASGGNAPENAERPPLDNTPSGRPCGCDPKANYTSEECAAAGRCRCEGTA